MAEKGIDFDRVDYTEQKLGANELRQLLHLAGLRPHEAIRKNEAIYRQHVADRNLDDEQLIELMVKHPELIQRPIIVRGNKAVLARPISKLADIGIE